MGAQIENAKYILVILLISLKCLGQNKVIELKKYAFSKCLDYNYQKIDSTFYQIYKDASAVQISIDGNFLQDDELKNRIIDYTISVTEKYYSQKNNLHFETGDKNIVFCNCINFYESKELDRFIKKTLSK